MTSAIATNRTAERRNAALEFLVERIDFERTLSMPGSEAVLKLDRMRELLARLGNPQNDLPIVHVAGTKGKGSTSAFVAAILSAAGYRTGLFTSPHLERVEERIVPERHTLHGRRTGRSGRSGSARRRSNGRGK